MNDQRHLERKQRRFCSSNFKERHKCRHPLTSLRVQGAFQTHTHIGVHNLLSKCHNIIIMQYRSLARMIHMNSNQDGCDALLAAAVLAGPNSKHAIISLLTTADGHKVLESPSKACSDYKPKSLALCACVCLSYCSSHLQAGICVTA